MGRRSAIKWERSTLCKPVHNIISSDFPKYTPQPWKLMEGRERMELLISHEYQRMWVVELQAWKKRMYPDTTVNIDIVKNYVLTFKANTKKSKPEKNAPKPKKPQGKEPKTSAKSASQNKETEKKTKILDKNKSE